MRVTSKDDMAYSPFCTFGRPELLYPLDIAFTAHGVAVLVVRLVSSGEWLVIPKYVRGGQGPWRDWSGTTLERLVETYSPQSIAKATARVEPKIRLALEPAFSRKVPILSSGDVEAYCSMRPGGWSDEAINYMVKVAGSDAAELAEALLLAHWECTRLTGSLLAGSFVAGVSDVDVVVDVSKPSCLSVVDELEAIASSHSLGGEEFRRHVEREARMRGIPSSILFRVFPRWARLRFGRLVASVSLVDYRSRMEPVRFAISYPEGMDKRVRLSVTLEPLQTLAASFPSIVDTFEGLKLVVFDGIYIPVLLKGGRFEVYGVKAVYVEADGEEAEAIVVGVAETTTYIKPLQ